MANGEDYNNILSADYWTPEAVKRRADERRASSQTLAKQQTQSNAAPWEAIGGFIGEAGKQVGNFFNDANNNAIDARREKQERRSYNKTPAIRPQLASKNVGWEIGNRSNRNPNPSGIVGNADGGIDPEIREERDPIDDILARLGEKFSYDSANDRSMDSQVSSLDQLLASKKGELNGLRDQSRSNWQESDNNVAAMHGAFQNEVRGQEAGIQQRGAESQANIGGIFNKTIDANNAQLQTQNASKLEMLQRLGIAPAANAEDSFATAVQQGNNAAQQGRDSRQSEQAVNTNTDIARNTQLVNSIGNEGVGRRSDLQGRLQEILGDIGSKEADLQTNYQQSRMEIQNTGEDRAYDRWLADRQFDMGLFDSYNQNLTDQIKAGAEAESKADSGMTGIDGLQANTSPQLRNAIVNVSRQVNIAREPEKAMQLLADPKYGLDPDEVFAYVTKYGKLGTNNKYPDPNE